MSSSSSSSSSEEYVVNFFINTIIKAAKIIVEMEEDGKDEGTSEPRTRSVALNRDHEVGCRDIHGDIFSESLNLEDTHLKEGFQEGYETGFASGKDDGREVGLKSGFITGEELGFYRGCVDVWNSVIQIEPTCFSARVQKNIKEMDELVSKYPILEPENESVTDIMGSLRLKFRAICATMNVKLEYNGYPKASDPNEIQF